MIVTKYHVIVYYASEFIPMEDKKLQYFINHRDYGCDNFSVEIVEGTPASSSFVQGEFYNWFEADDFNEALIDFLEKSPNHKVVY